MTAHQYWLSFNIEWNNLAVEANKAGQWEMAEFFAELADDAGDMWAGVYGPLEGRSSFLV